MKSVASVPFSSAALLEVAVHTNLSLDLGEAAVSIVCTLRAAAETPAAVVTEITFEGLPAVEVGDPITLFPGETVLVQSLTLPRVRLWQPAVRGSQPLYAARVALVDPEGLLLDRHEFRFGVRDVAWSDAEGLRVNGSIVPVRAWRWPESPAGADCTRRRVQLALAAGVTLLLVPPPAVEDDAIYATCDSLGLLVAQELGGTGADPEEEVEQALRRRRNHPSLALWVADPAPAPAGSAGADVVGLLQLEDPQRPYLMWPPVGTVVASQPDGGDPVTATRSFQCAVETARSSCPSLLFGGDLVGSDRRSAGVLLDGAGTPAAAGSAARRAHRPFWVSAVGLDTDWAAATAFQAEIRLHNDGAARSLLNVVATVTDASGREMYQENLAAEAPAHTTELAGDLYWRFPPGFSGWFFLFLEVVDEEGEAPARNAYSLCRGAAPAPAPSRLVLEPNARGWTVRNAGDAVAAGGCVELSDFPGREWPAPLRPGEALSPAS